MKKMKPHVDSGLLFIRIFIGLSYLIIHGWPKISGGPAYWEKVGAAISKMGIAFMPVLWGFLASAAEFGGGLLIVLGILFRPALTFLILTMFVASLHFLISGEGIMKAAYPLEMMVVLIGLFLTGPGKYTIYKYFSQKNRESK